MRVILYRLQVLMFETWIKSWGEELSSTLLLSDEAAQHPTHPELSSPTHDWWQCTGRKVQTSRDKGLLCGEKKETKCDSLTDCINLTISLISQQPWQGEQCQSLNGGYCPVSCEKLCLCHPQSCWKPALKCNHSSCQKHPFPCSSPNVPSLSPCH